jgi:integrase
VVYRRRSSAVWYLAVPTRTGWVKRSAGTTDRPTARAMERMLDELRGQRAWDLLAPVASGTLAIGTLYDAWRANDLATLRARQSDEDLTTHLSGWEAWLVDRVTPSTREHYLAHVRTLMPTGRPYWRSAFSSAAIARWLAQCTALVQKRRPATKGSRRKDDPPARPLSGSTKRKYLAAVSSFGTYLREIGILERNPARDVTPPPPGRPRVVDVLLPDVIRIVDGARTPYRALFALLYGAGIEISAALALRRRDVDMRRREVRAPGTKSHSRDRVVRVAEWAWPRFSDALADRLPDALLFPGIDRWGVGDYHRAHLKALALAHHRLHDARHVYAIRAVRAGVPYELVARQLGHADVAMVAKVYGRFAPGHQDRERWEHVADARDREEFGELFREKIAGHGALDGAVGPRGPHKPREKKWGSDEASGSCENSWGGTRTRDPGIMSAVL